MQKWEYLRLDWAGLGGDPYPLKLTFSHREPPWAENHEGWPRGWKETMRRLGDEGWELVVVDGSTNVFKRPLPEST